jgi:hypothetical protein
MIAEEYDLLKAFRSLFEGTQYLHRDSGLGDWVASYLYEDLSKLRKSSKLNKRILAGTRVLNSQNRTIGIARRRGDGTFGELVPAGNAIREEGLVVARGPVATIENWSGDKDPRQGNDQANRQSDRRSAQTN